MALACLVYIAKLNPKIDQVRLLEHNDTNTRANAKCQITGVLMIAGGYLLEILEGEYSLLELNLDQIAAIGLIDDPEILIFTPLKVQQFSTWKMGVIESHAPISEDLSVLRILGAQTQSDPGSTPGAVLRILKEFHAQFACEDSGHSAA